MKTKTFKFSFTFLLFITFNFTNAQKINETPKYNSVFWEISGNGLEQPSYLLGTIHIIPEADYFFPEYMQEKFNTCRTFVIEANIDAPLKEQIAMVKMMLLPDGKTIDKFLTTEQFQEFETIYLDSVGVKKSTFKKIMKLKPLYGQMSIFNDIVKNPTAYEKELSKLAKKNKMQIKFLETLDFQFQIFESISIEKQIEMMFADKDLQKNPKTEYYKMLSLYKNQNLNALFNLTLEDDLMKKFENKLLTDRNTDWIPKIENLIKKQPTFIAVGSAHLAGEKGVISLLRKQGYTVKAIKE